MLRGGALEWPGGVHPQEEYALGHFISGLVFVFILILLGWARSAVSRMLALQQRVDPNQQQQKDFSIEHRKLALLVWNRLLGEVALIGSLALFIWLSNRAKLLDLLAAYASQWSRPPPESAPPALNATWRHPHMAARVANALSCHPRMPPDHTALLHLVYDAHFSLLFASLFYFGFIAVVLHTMMQWLVGYKRLECGASARNPAEHFAMRQLDAMRSQLLDAFRNEPRVRGPLDKSGELRESVEREALYVCHFLAEVGHAHIERLTDFVTPAWLIVAAYLAFMATMLFNCAPWRSLTLLLDFLWYGLTVYLGYRLLLHAGILRQNSRVQQQPSTQQAPWPRAVRDTWPHAWVDRVCFLCLGPGVTGFVPCSRPSELIGIRFLQGVLFVQFYRVGEYLTDPANEYPFWDLMVRVLPKLLSLLLWAVWLVPGMLEVFSLPPFLGDLELSLLLFTLRSYPNGFPPDERLIDPARSPMMLRGLPRTPISFSSGLAYVVHKGQGREQDQHRWPQLTSWQGWRQVWRWMLGSPPLADPARRLADHHAWITAEAQMEREGRRGTGIATPTVDERAPEPAATDSGVADGSPGSFVTARAAPSPGETAPATPVARRAMPSARESRRGEVALI